MHYYQPRQFPRPLLVPTAARRLTAAGTPVLPTATAPASDAAAILALKAQIAALSARVLALTAKP